MSDSYLEVRGLSKTFSGTTVVRDVSFALASGDVVGLVGPNGCGKSTVIKMLSGYHAPDPGGQITVAGVSLGPADDRRRHGMAFVHQDPALVPDANVVENLALGSGYRTGTLWRIDWRRAKRDAQALLDTFAIRGRPDSLVRDMAAADVTLLAIARALASLPSGPSLLVLDEPTSSLTDAEVERVLEAVRGVAARGAGVLFVSHRLGEVLSVTDRVLVMRDGRIVAVRDATEVGERALVELMLGRPLERLVPEAPQPQHGMPVLELVELAGRRLVGLTLTLHPGEIIGVTGLVGSGKTELGRLLAGAERPTSGKVRIGGLYVSFGQPRDAIAAGVSYVPPERRTQGGIGGFAAFENLTLPDLRTFLRRGWLDKHAEARETRRWMEATGAIPRDPARPFATFSGGNQQKLVFARSIRLKPRVLVLDEPTQGVDVGAVQDLYRLVREVAAAGVGVILLSSEWDDIARLCHRTLVLDRGRIVAELRAGENTADHIAAAAFAAGRVSHGAA